MTLGPLQPVFGAAVILLIAYALSTNRRAIRWSTVAWGLGLQIVFAIIVLKTSVGERVFTIRSAPTSRSCSVSPASAPPSSSVPLGDNAVWTKVMTGALGPDGAQSASMFAFQVLPTIIFIAALFAILYYFGVMQLVVRLFAVVMHRVMKASGAESLNVAASIFMGQTEAPLTIRPYLPEMTQSELMTVMTSGMAHISGGIMAAYILFGVEAKHLLTAVIMTAPGTIMMAKMFVPETEVPEDDGVGAAGSGADRRQRHRRRRPGHGRRAPPGAQRRRHADLVPGAHCARQRDAGRRPPEPRADIRLGVRAGGMEHGRAVAATRRRSGTCSARAWR